MTNAQRAVVSFAERFTKALEEASLAVQPTGETLERREEWIMNRADLSEFVRRCAVRAGKSL